MLVEENGSQWQLDWMEGFAFSNAINRLTVEFDADTKPAACMREMPAGCLELLIRKVRSECAIYLSVLKVKIKVI